MMSEQCRSDRKGRRMMQGTRQYRIHSYLVIRLVFPTLWSPRRTILLRFKGGEEKSAVTGVLDDIVGRSKEEQTDEIRQCRTAVIDSGAWSPSQTARGCLLMFVVPMVPG